MKRALTSITKIPKALNQASLKLGVLLTLCASSTARAGDSIIPTPNISGGDNSISQDIIEVAQKYVIPVIEMGAAIWLLWTCITTLMHGLNETKKQEGLGPLKEAIIKIVILIAVGGLIIVLLEKVRKFGFSG